LLQENAVLKKEMEQVLNKEKHLQQLATLKEQNRISADRIAYLKDMERKLRQLVLDWKKTEDKAKVINNLKNLLFTKKEEVVVNKLAKKVNNQYKENLLPVEVGCKAKHKINYQVGVVKELKGKRAVLQVGQVLINVNITDLARVEELPKETV
jgi:DNA mismatch repair protein MutS2